MDDLKDPLIGNLVFAGKIGDAFATGVSGTYPFVAFRFGEVFREHWRCGTGNAEIEAVKHTLDSAVHGGYSGDVEARSTEISRVAEILLVLPDLVVMFVFPFLGTQFTYMFRVVEKHNEGKGQVTICMTTKSARIRNFTVLGENAPNYSF